MASSVYAGPGYYIILIMSQPEGHMISYEGTISWFVTEFQNSIHNTDIMLSITYDIYSYNLEYDIILCVRL